MSRVASRELVAAPDTHRSLAERGEYVHPLEDEWRPPK
ncbi:hypothetical protein ACP70R_025477 [Stipagrostis hirtigluma subsp. patula]